MRREEVAVEERESGPAWPARVALLWDADDPDQSARWRQAGIEPLHLLLPPDGESQVALCAAVAASARAFVLPGEDEEARALAEAIRETTGRPAILAPQAARVRTAAEVLARLGRPDEGSTPPAVGLVGPLAEAAGELLLAQGVARSQLHKSSGRDADASLRPGSEPAPRPAAFGAPAGRPGPAGARPAPAPAPRDPHAPDLSGLKTALSVLVLPAGWSQELPEALREAPRVGARTSDEARLVLPGLVRAAVDLDALLPDAAALSWLARALADLAGEEGLPSPADPRVVPALVRAAAQALGQERPDRWARALIEARSPLRRALRAPLERARQAPPSLVLVDGEDPRVIAAASALGEAGLAVPWLLGDAFRIEARAKADKVPLEQVRIVDPKRDKRRAAYADALLRVLGARLGLTATRAGELVTTPLLFGATALLVGEAQALICPEGDGLEPLGLAAELLPRRAAGRSLAGAHLLAGQDGQLRALADTAARSDPTAEELADAAEEAGRLLALLLGRPARTALLGPGDQPQPGDPAAARLALARDVVRARSAEAEVAGPLRASTALDPEALQGRSTGLSGPAEVLVLADRAGALALTGALERLGGAEVAGTLLLGVEATVVVPPPGAGPATLELLGAIAAARAAVSPRPVAWEPGGNGGRAATPPAPAAPRTPGRPTEDERTRTPPGAVPRPVPAGTTRGLATTPSSIQLESGAPPRGVVPGADAPRPRPSGGRPLP